MKDETLVFTTDTVLLVHRAHAAGLTTVEIIRALTCNEVRATYRKIAIRYAPPLGLSVEEFLAIARQRE